MLPTSATYFGISGYIIFWVLFVIAFGLFAQRTYFLFRLIRLGKPENRFDQVWKRFKNMAREVVTQRCSLKSVTRKDLAGIGHAMLFWGFSFFLLSYIIFIGFAGGFGLASVLTGNTFERVFSSILDFAGLFVTIAIIWAAIRRYIIRPARLERSMEAGVIMIMVFCLMVLHFGVDGFGLAAAGTTTNWPPIGGAIARYLMSTSISTNTLTAVYRSLWWLHYALILGFMVYIPRSKHMHILASIFNTMFIPFGQKVVLEPIPVEQQENFGISKIQDFTWKDLLDLYSCAVCGRCNANCPAQLTGKKLAPREVIHNLKEHLLAAGPGLLNVKTATVKDGKATEIIGGVVTEDEIWACTTCGACQEVCPVNIEHVRKLIGFRRNLVMSQSKMPESAQLMLRNMQSRGNPWAGVTSMRLRGDWANEAGVKVLADGESAETIFWAGCTGALVERNVKATLAMAKVFKTAGVDFGVLGDAETCCGDPARRAGYEFQFQIMAEQNIEIFKSHNIKQIVTACPHCYNTLKNEYPKFGGDFQVVHYTEFIADLIKQGKLKLTGDLNSKITYHDPCYLGRYNNIYEQPRQILQSISKAKLLEMERSHNSSFCCGGGGGLMWIEEQPGTTKINQMRLDDALKTGADTVVTACPYCLQMFEESIDHQGIKDKVRAVDLVELVAEATK